MNLARPASAVRLAQFYLAAFAVGITGSALAAPAFLPPAGLYRIDTDGTMASPGANTEMRITTDGVSGNTTQRARAAGRQAQRQYQGNGPVTHCVKTASSGVFPAPAQAGACTVVSALRSGDSFVQTSSCAMGKVSVSIRQLDRDRWEFLTDVATVTTGAAPDLSAMTPVLKHRAEHGETAQVRAQAREQLAQLPAMQRESNASYAETVARMEEELRTTTDPEEKAAITAALSNFKPGKPMMNYKSRAVWTRIGNACS